MRLRRSTFLATQDKLQRLQEQNPNHQALNCTDQEWNQGTAAVDLCFIQHTKNNASSAVAAKNSAGEGNDNSSGISESDHDLTDPFADDEVVVHEGVDICLSLQDKDVNDAKLLDLVNTQI